ncbi:Hypothetical protein KLENKIAIHU_1638, partial [Klenkia terrae]
VPDEPAEAVPPAVAPAPAWPGAPTGEPVPSAPFCAAAPASALRCRLVSVVAGWAAALITAGLNGLTVPYRPVAPSAAPRKSSPLSDGKPWPVARLATMLPPGEATVFVAAVEASPVPVRASRLPAPGRFAPSTPRPMRLSPVRPMIGAIAPAPINPPAPPPIPAATVESTFQSVRVPWANWMPWLIASIATSSSTSSTTSWARCRATSRAVVRATAFAAPRAAAAVMARVAAARPAEDTSLEMAWLTTVRAVCAIGPSVASETPPAQAMSRAMKAAATATATATLIEILAYCSSVPKDLVCIPIAVAFWMCPTRPNSGEDSSCWARSWKLSVAGASQPCISRVAAFISSSAPVDSASARPSHSSVSSQTADSLPSGHFEPAKIIDSRSFHQPSDPPNQANGLVTSSGCSTVTSLRDPCLPGAPEPALGRP